MEFIKRELEIIVGGLDMLVKYHGVNVHPDVLGLANKIKEELKIEEPEVETKTEDA